MILNRHLCNLFRQLDHLKFKRVHVVLSTDNFDSEFKDEWFLKKSAWTFCQTKTKNV